MTFLNALWSPYVYRLERHIWVCTDNSGQQVEQLYATEMSCVTAKTAKLQNWGGGGGCSWNVYYLWPSNERHRLNRYMTNGSNV
jgi:hypothetical protein